VYAPKSPGSTLASSLSGYWGIGASDSEPDEYGLDDTPELRPDRTLLTRGFKGSRELLQKSMQIRKHPVRFRE
jgi:hypothetical protein